MQVKRALWPFCRPDLSQFVEWSSEDNKLQFGPYLKSIRYHHSAELELHLSYRDQPKTYCAYKQSWCQQDLHLRGLCLKVLMQNNKQRNGMREWRDSTAAAPVWGENRKGDQCIPSITRGKEQVINNNTTLNFSVCAEIWSIFWGKFTKFIIWDQLHKQTNKVYKVTVKDCSSKLFLFLSLPLSFSLSPSFCYLSWCKWTSSFIC